MSEFKRVGSTDICMKCAIAHGDGRNCKCAPEEKAFFIELPPYRNFIIVGITAPRCPHVGCTRPDCDGNHEVHGPCIDAPRGGFEFL